MRLLFGLLLACFVLAGRPAPSSAGLPSFASAIRVLGTDPFLASASVTTQFPTGSHCPCDILVIARASPRGWIAPRRPIVATAPESIPLCAYASETASEGPFKFFDPLGPEFRIGRVETLEVLHHGPNSVMPSLTCPGGPPHGESRSSTFRHPPFASRSGGRKSHAETCSVGPGNRSSAVL